MSTEAAIHELIELVRGPQFDQLDADNQLAVCTTIQAHQIERYSALSKRPGVPGYRGASPKQLKMRDAFRSGRYRVIAASGANQSSKTVAIGGLCLCEHLRDRAGDGDVYWVIAQTNETVRDIPAKTIWEFLPRAMFPAGVTYHPRLGFGQIQTMELVLPDGRGKCEVWFKSEEMAIGRFESARLHGVWWSECRRERLFDVLQPRLAAHQGFLLMDFVPLEGWHIYRVKVPAETGDPDVYHVRFAMMDNAHNLPEGEIDYQRRRMTAEQAAIRIDGKDGAVFGAIYPQFDLERHIVAPFPIPPDAPRWRTYDYGFRNPATCLWAAVLPVNFEVPDLAGEVWGGVQLKHEVLVVYREYFQAGQTVPQQAAQIKQLSDKETYERSVIADPSIFNVTQVGWPGPPRSIADLFGEEGLPMIPGVRASAVDETSMVNRVRLWFEADKVWFFKTCGNAIREHQVWKYRENTEGQVPGKEPFEDRDNHTCDALKELIAEEPIHQRFEPYIEDTDPDSPFYGRDQRDWPDDPDDVDVDVDDEFALERWD